MSAMRPTTPEIRLDVTQWQNKAGNRRSFTRLLKSNLPFVPGYVRRSVLEVGRRNGDGTSNGARDYRGVRLRAENAIRDAE